eukprot:EG_transcript_13267
MEDERAETHAVPGEVDAFASSQDFQPGDLVLTESPSIVFHLLPENSPLFRYLDNVAKAADVVPASLYCLVNLSKCSAEWIKTMEEQFPVPAVPIDHPICVRFMAAGQLLAQSSLLPSGSDPARYCDILLRVRLYARHVTLAEGVPALALYPQSVKIQHSCYPNLLHFADEATLLYRALRPIAVGDLLTIAYIEDVELWKGTPQRQQYILKSRFYKCTCARCLAPDVARAMHCKSCGSDEVYHHPISGRWLCTALHCGREYDGSEMPLSAEGLLIDYINTLFTKETDPSIDYVATLRHTQQTLGSRHWAAALLTYLILAKFGNAPPAQLPRCLTRRLMATMAEYLGDWFLKVMRHSVPTARMCLFAAGILATHPDPEHQAKAREFEAAAQATLAILEQ